VHPKILTSTQKDVLRRASAWVTEEGFYLAGGTALALQLGHRESYDFDWFREAPIDKPDHLVESFEGAVAASFDRQLVKPDTVLGFVKGVKASFFRYPYALLAAPVTWAGCHLAALEDIAAMKMLAIAQRGTKRDFIDVHELAKSFDLTKMIEHFVEKYPAGDVPSLLRALTYFKDAEEDPMPKMFTKVTWSQIKRDIQRIVDKYNAA